VPQSRRAVLHVGSGGVLGRIEALDGNRHEGGSGGRVGVLLGQPDLFSQRDGPTNLEFPAADGFGLPARALEVVLRLGNQGGR
jgi:hypothetical protein